METNSTSLAPTGAVESRTIKNLIKKHPELFAATVVGILFLTSFLTTVFCLHRKFKYCRKKNRRSQDSNEETNNTIAEALPETPPPSLKEGENRGQWIWCAIETDHIPRSQCKELPCGHLFSKNRLNEWFKKNEQPTCPTCRSIV